MKSNIVLGVWTLAACSLFAPAHAETSSVNLGFDYDLHAVSISNNDGLSDTKDHLGYYNHRARAYLNGWVNKDIEASLVVQSINVWGMETSTTPLASPYPSAVGTPWIEQAWVNLPHLAGNRLDLRLGRQPINIGDGTLVSDDQAGFNAIRAIFSLPWNSGLDVFTAKAEEGLAGNNDFDLTGVVGSYRKDHNLWELSLVREDNNGISDYVLGGTTQTATEVIRSFVDLRLFSDLKDAYYKIELALCQGHAQVNNSRVKISGKAEKIELGASADTVRFGRFGVKALYASGSGDSPDSPDKDESFRPTFSKRWDGLQRSGWGRHFGATLSDAYNPSAPFSNDATGLPAGASGIKTMGLGLFTVQKINWTGTLDYFTYDSRIKVSGQNSLGAELDLGVVYRYTSAVTFNLGASTFFPGDVFGPQTSKVTRYTAETNIHF